MIRSNIVKNIFSKKTVDYTFAILFFLIFSIFIIFAIKPSLMIVFSLKKEEFDLRKINTLYENKILNITEIQSKIEENRDYLPLLNQAVPSSSQVNKMISDIKSAAEGSSFFITEANVSDINLISNNKGKLQTFKISIEGMSSFEDTLKLISNLFNQRRLKTIKKLTISSDLESTASSRLKVVLDVEGFYL